MGDHLDYIRIRGLVDSAAECFQGIAGSTAAGSNEGTADLSWGEIPAEAISLLAGYTQDLIAWLGKANTYDPDSGTRGLPALLEDIPLVPEIVETAIVAGGAAATGGLALPAVATVMGVQAITNFTAAALQEYAVNLDENSPRNQLIELVNTLKTAFLREDQSILDLGLNYDLEIDGKTEHRSILKDKLEDIAYLDLTLHFADNTSLSVKGKVLKH